MIPTDPVLGPLFVTFSEKVMFSLEGLVKVEHLVLARWVSFEFIEARRVGPLVYKTNDG